MCLITTTNKAKKAKEDIICYKELILSTKDNIEFCTPYRHKDADINKLLKGKFISIKNYLYFLFTHKWYRGELVSDTYAGIKYYGIEDGFIHSYKYKGDKEFKPLIFKPLIYHPGITFECVIPKGTWYYESDTTYASRKIKFIKKIN